MKINIHFRSYLAPILLRMTDFSDKVVEKPETHILYSITFYENCAVYEIMWKNTVEPDRPHAYCMLDI